MGTAWESRVHVEDHLGNKLYVRDLLEIFDISEAYIRENIRRGCSTLSELVQTLKERYYKKVRQKKAVMRHTIRGLMSDSQIAKEIGGSKHLVRSRGYQYGFMSHVLFISTGLTREEFAIELERALEKDKTQNTEFEFDEEALNVTWLEWPQRRQVCYRENFEVRCIHYNSCQDARLNGAHHERYFADGSCFVAEEMGQKVHGAS